MNKVEEKNLINIYDSEIDNLKIQLNLLQKRISELEAENEKYSVMSRTSPDSIVVTRLRDGKIIDINTEFERQFGFSKKDSIGNTTLDIKLWKDLAKRKEYIDQIEKYNEIKNFGTYLFSKVGNRIDVDLSSSMVKVNDEDCIITIIKNKVYEKQTEFALMQSLESLNQIYYNLPIGVYRTSVKGEILTANPALINMLGFSDLSEMLGRNLEKSGYKYNEDRIRFKEEIKKTGEIKGFETVWLTKEGREIYIRENARAIREIDGNVIYYEGTVEDITAVKKSNEQIKMLSLAVEQNPNPIVVTDIFANIEYVNTSFTKVTGYTFEDVKGQNPSLLKSGITPQSIYKDMWEKINEGKKWSGELQNRKKDGSLYWEHMVVFPVRNSHNKITHYLAFKEDITEYKEYEQKILEYNQSLENIVKKRTQSLEEVKSQLEIEIKNRIEDQIKLQENYDFLTILLDTMPNAIFVKNSDLVYTDCNKALLEIFGLKKEEVIGKTIHDFASAEIADYHTNQDKLLFENKQLQVYESNYIDKNGNKKHSITYKTLFYKKDGSIGGIIGVSLDITDRKNFEHELMLTLQKEIELNEMKTKFISTASHEFRTPLTSILASADLLEMYGRKWNEEKYLNYISKIQSAVEKMTNLLSGVLTISRTDAKKVEFNPQLTNFKELIEKIIDELSTNLKTGQNILLKYDIAQRIKIDGNLINLILSNLIGNAIKYSFENSDIRIEVDENQIGKKQIKIIDQGIGISKNDQKNIFEAFNRGENAVDIPGTGLGLSIVKQAAEIHKIELFFDSKLNEGTTFTLIINDNE